MSHGPVDGVVFDVANRPIADFAHATVGMLRLNASHYRRR